MWLESVQTDDMRGPMVNHVILIQKFISIPYKKGKVGDFLNEVKSVTNQLDFKEAKLLEQFITAQVLEKLDSSFDAFKASIYNSL